MAALPALPQDRDRERGLDTNRAILIVIAVRDREVQVLPGRALLAVDRELNRRGMLADLAPLFREGRYFEALMTLNTRLAELVRTHGPSTAPRREAGRRLGPPVPAELVRRAAANNSGSSDIFA